MLWEVCIKVVRVYVALVRPFRFRRFDRQLQVATLTCFSLSHRASPHNHRCISVSFLHMPTSDERHQLALLSMISEGTEIEVLLVLICDKSQRSNWRARCKALCGRM